MILSDSKRKLIRIRLEEYLVYKREHPTLINQTKILNHYHTMYNKNSLFAGALLMLAATQAKIVTDSPLWENDWYDNETKMGVKNGEPYSKDEAVQRFINAPRTIEGDVPNYRQFENVKRVMRVFD